MAKRTKSTKVAKAKTSAEAGTPPKRGAGKVRAGAGGTPPGDWREETLARVRGLILAAVPGVMEERKWKKASNPAGAPVWSHHGIICTGETYKNSVKLTFAKGAALADPSGLFNAGLEGGTRRAIDIREGETVSAGAFKALVKAAAAANSGSAKGEIPVRKGGAKAGKVKLLSGGNPQIAKAEGDAPVRAYIAALPGWKRALGDRLDALIVRSVPRPPGVRKAVKWNSPFYGVEGGEDWFASFHTFTRYVKVTFFRGALLRPAPPGGTGKDARWIDVGEDGFDEGQMAEWIKQAAAMPGWAP